MNVKDKISGTLDLIKYQFKSHDLFKSYEIKTTDEKEVEILKMYDLTWDFDMNNFRCNVDRDIAKFSSHTTLIIAYDKIKDILRISLNKKAIRPGREDVLKYVPIDQLILTVKQNGCFTFKSGKPFRVNYNTIRFINNEILSYKVKVSLVNELQDGIVDRLGLINYIPPKFQNCNSLTELRHKIDSKDFLDFIGIDMLIRLYGVLKPKYFKRLGSTLKGSRYPGKPSLGEVIDIYYTKRYPTFRKRTDSSVNVYDLVNLLQYENPKILPKLELVHPTKISKYVQDIKYKVVCKSNKLFSNNLIGSTRGIKRKMNKLVKPNFKFTHEWITTNEQLKESFNEIEHVLFYGVKKQLWLKIYIKGKVIIIGSQYSITHSSIDSEELHDHLNVIKDNVDTKLFQELFDINLPDRYRQELFIDDVLF